MHLYCNNSECSQTCWLHHVRSLPCRCLWLLLPWWVLIDQTHDFVSSNCKVERGVVDNMNLIFKFLQHSWRGNTQCERQADFRVVYEAWGFNCKRGIN